MTAPGLVIVTVTYNAATVIADFLASLQEQTFDDWRLVIVDNASADATLAILAARATDPRIEVVRSSTNTGAAEGNNIGLRRAAELDAAMILLTNNDVVFGPQTLAALIAAKRGLPPGAISATLIYDEATPRVWFNGGKIERLFGVRCIHKEVPAATGAGTAPYETTYAPTTFMLLDRKAVSAVGEIDAVYFAYWEDADYIWRLRQMGYRLWVSPAVVVTHKISASSGGSGSIYSNQQYYRNQLIFARKHFGVAMMLYTAAASCARITVRRLLGRDDRRMTAAKVCGLGLGLRRSFARADNHGMSR